MKKKKRANSPCNRLDEEQLVAVSIFKCWSKNVYDDDDDGSDHHHHQEARSMSYSSSFVSLLTITSIHLAFDWNERRGRKEEKKTRSFDDNYTWSLSGSSSRNLHWNFFFLFSSNCPPSNGHPIRTHNVRKADTQCDLHLFICFVTTHFQA